MGARAGIADDELRRMIEDHDNGNERIPFARRVFWNRLCERLGEWAPECVDAKACIEWLVKDLGRDRAKTVKRWAGLEKPCTPQWGSLREVGPGLSKTGSGHDLFALLRGLPLGDAPSDDPTDEPNELLPAILKILNTAPQLTAHLAKQGYVTARISSKAESVARALLHKAVDQLVEDLVRVFGMLEPHPRDRAAIRELLWTLLPFLPDWDDVPVRADGALDKIGTLDLRWSTATVAEIMVARVEARACHFVPAAPYPVGPAGIKMPVSNLAPMFDKEGERLAEGVVLNMAAEEPWRQIRHDATSNAAYLIQVASKTRLAALQGRSHYLLFIDKKLDGELRDLDASWAVAQGALGKVLPHLRLVRLRGDLDPKEAFLRDAIQLVHGPTGQP